MVCRRNKLVDIRDLRTKDGQQVPASALNSGTKRCSLRDVYVISTFGILVFALRQRKIDGDWLKSAAFDTICAKVNMVDLENLGANTDANNLRR